MILLKKTPKQKRSDDKDLNRKLREKGVSDEEISKLDKTGKEKLLKKKSNEKKQGTPSDLRGKTMADLDRLLREKGITEDQLSRLSRWDKVKLLREIINNEKEKGVDNEETRRYARDLQSKAKAQKENYKKIYEETFKTNYMFISSSNTSLESNENVEFSLEMARDLESDSDDSNDDDENDSTTENEQTNKETNDPKELVKMGFVLLISMWIGMN